MHDLIGGFSLGYHGCSTETAEKLLAGEAFNPSENDYDWLGPGIYFWESNAIRALEFAKEALRRKGLSADNAALVGAVISSGFTLDLLSKAGQDAVSDAHKDLVQLYEQAEAQLPINSPEPMLNYLDCLVIRHIHKVREKSNQRPIQLVRGVFIEGKPLYESSAFYSKTHIQIAVHDSNCIKGVFRVPPQDLE